jgi:hypothetical protein
MFLSVFPCLSFHLVPSFPVPYLSSTFISFFHLSFSPSVFPCLFCSFYFPSCLSFSHLSSFLIPSSSLCFLRWCKQFSYFTRQAAASLLPFIHEHVKHDCDVLMRCQ